MTTAITVLSFSVVLAEAFAAVGLSTLIPALFVQLCRGLRGTTEIQEQVLKSYLPMLLKALPLPGLPEMPLANATDLQKKDYDKAIKPFTDAVKKLIRDSDKLQLLVPKSGHIDATFTCGGSENYGVHAGAEGVIQVVGVKAGFSAMFELHSSTTINLKMEFAPVEFDL